MPAPDPRPARESVHCSPPAAPPAARRRLRAGWMLGSLLLPLTQGCSVASRLDVGHLFSRQGWQRTDRVIETLAIPRGATVADLGAGDGYFSVRLAEAVGPEGTVYAVEVDEPSLDALRAAVAERGLENVRPVLATSRDAKLPAGAIDLVFLCNAYHHFEDRVAYFRRLQEALAPDARIAVIDGRSEGPATWFLPSGHWLEPGQLAGELAQSGYVQLESYDFLPLQTFDVFERAEAR